MFQITGSTLIVSLIWGWLITPVNLKVVNSPIGMIIERNSSAFQLLPFTLFIGTTKVKLQLWLGYSI
jgi:hypothetical protein